MRQASSARRRIARRRALGLAAALAVHTLLLLVFVVDMDRNAAFSVAQDRDQVVIHVALAPASAVRPRRRPPVPASTPGARAGPTKSAPESAAPQPPASEARASPGEAPAPAQDAAVAKALRGSVGCAHARLVNLTDEERRRCDQAFADIGRHAEPYDLNMSPEARASFDLAVKENQTAHPPAFGCLAKFGLGKFVWYHPSRGVKLGPLPCYFVAPKAIPLPDPDPPKGFF